MRSQKIIVAPDSFKGTLSALAAAEAIGAGWSAARPGDNVTLLPQADGGEGTLDAIERAAAGAVRRSAGLVTGPDGRPTPGEWIELPGGVAVVELAQACGLPLMARLDASRASTRGMGEVILDALKSGATSLVIALGGSASTDAGTGALTALGLRLLNSGGQELPGGGGALANLSRVDSSALLSPPSGGVTLLTDVTTPLLGPHGCAAVFGPQKGASRDDVRALDSALSALHGLVGGNADEPGAGAAGGTAYGFAALWGGRIVSGGDHLATLTGLDSALESADALVTGEGRFDAQSMAGKVVGTLVERANHHGVTPFIIAGQVTLKSDLWATSLTELSGSTAAAMGETARWLREAGVAAANEFSRRVGP
ncbi:MAG: glycerate kinase [Actinobacteria bacterium]|nr:glycerate kinase [Actinomycetota bacterium]